MKHLVLLFALLSLIHSSSGSDVTIADAFIVSLPDTAKKHAQSAHSASVSDTILDKFSDTSWGCCACADSYRRSIQNSCFLGSHYHHYPVGCIGSDCSGYRWSPHYSRSLARLLLGEPGHGADSVDWKDIGHLNMRAIEWLTLVLGFFPQPARITPQATPRT